MLKKKQSSYQLQSSHSLKAAKTVDQREAESRWSSQEYKKGWGEKSRK